MTKTVGGDPRAIFVCPTCGWEYHVLVDMRKGVGTWVEPELGEEGSKSLELQATVGI